MTMCLDCGCGKLNDSHGDARHITMDSVRAAAEASQLSVDKTIENIQTSLDEAKSSATQTAGAD
jgi:predicted  nucleic acid-binding Zn-ribbon protein